MSYIVQVWETPADQALPASIEDACKLLDQLQQIQPGQNPKFIALAKRLMQRFPFPGEDGDDCDDVSASDWAWTDGVIDGISDAAVYNLGLGTERLVEVRPFVIEQALALGLCVLDEQAGELYLAGGKVLSMRPSATPRPEEENKEDDVPKTKEMARIVFERLTPLLARHGFKARKRDRTFVCAFAKGWHEISIVADADIWPMPAEFDVFCGTRFNAVSDLLCSLLWPERSPAEVAEKMTFCLTLHRWMDDSKLAFQGVMKRYEVSSYSMIDPVMDHLILKLETLLLPLLKRCETIKGLDDVMSQEPLSHSPFLSAAGGDIILAAYLAGNPHLEDLCEKLLKQFEKSNKLLWVQRCVEYVRSHPLAKSN